MRPFKILDCIDLTPKSPRPQRELKLRHAVGVWIGMIIFFLAMALTGCNSTAAQAITATDSTRTKASDTSKTDSPLVGAWRVQATGIDTMEAIAFLSSGRYIRSSPSCGGYGNGPRICEPDIEAGTWTASAGSVVLSRDSSGVLRTSRLASPDDRCDSLICWQESQPDRQAYSYALTGDMLTIDKISYERVSQ